jgi:hypothetical protein
MGAYFFLIIFVFFAAFISSINTSVNKRILFTFLTISAIILLQALRKSVVGIDVQTYLFVFNLIADGGGKTLTDFTDDFFNMEFGYITLNKIIVLFNQDSQIFLGIVSAAIFIPIGYVIYKNSQNILLSIISLISFLIFNFTFSGLRQSIAIAMTFLSFELIKKRKWVWFVALVLLASSFHKSALVFLPAYLLYNLKIKRKYFVIILIGLIVVLIGKSSVIGLILSLPFLNKYSTYNIFLTSGTGAYSMFFIMLFIYSVSMLIPKANEISKSLNAYRNYLLVATMIQIAASVSQVAMRAGFYYFIFVILILPEITITYKNVKSRNGIIFLIIVFCLYFHAYTTINSSLDPYLFYWE